MQSIPLAPDNGDSAAGCPVAGIRWEKAYMEVLSKYQIIYYAMVTTCVYRGEYVGNK